MPDAAHTSLMSCHDDSPGHEGADHSYVTDEAVILHDIRTLLRQILAVLREGAEDGRR